jgi:hypothetical protein
MTRATSGKILEQSDLDVSPITAKAYEKAVASLRHSHAEGKQIATKVMEFGNLGTSSWRLFVFDEPGVNLRDYLYAAEKAVRDANRLDLEKIISRWKKEYNVVRSSLEHPSAEVVYEPIFSSVGTFYNPPKTSDEIAQRVFQAKFLERSREIYLLQEKDNPVLDGFLEAVTQIAGQSGKIFDVPVPQTYEDGEYLSIRNKM